MIMVIERMTYKTISISEEVHSDLKELKIIDRETFNEVISRIINENKKQEREA